MAFPLRPTSPQFRVALAAPKQQGFNGSKDIPAQVEAPVSKLSAGIHFYSRHGKQRMNLVREKHSKGLGFRQSKTTYHNLPDLGGQY